MSSYVIKEREIVFLCSQSNCTIKHTLEEQKYYVNNFLYVMLVFEIAFLPVDIKTGMVNVCFCWFITKSDCKKKQVESRGI